MSNYYNPSINHLALGELSRRKLHLVSMLPSDTLRRAVLIHNIVRSTASLPPSPTTPTPQSQSQSQFEPAHEYYHLPSPASEECTYAQGGVPSQSEMNYREAAAVSPATDAGPDGSMYVFPSAMTSSAQEQEWLDSLLDDLEEDTVHVSVVEAEDHDGSESEVEDTYSMFATAATSCTSTPTQSTPPVRPTTIPYRHHQTVFSDPVSPPRSPPELDAHSFSDDDDDDYMDDSDGDDEVITPSSSTEIGSSDSYFFGPPPFHCTLNQ